MNILSAGMGRALLVAMAICWPACAVSADDAYFDIGVVDLPITEGQLPKAGGDPVLTSRIVESFRYTAPWVVLDADGEAYVRGPDYWNLTTKVLGNLALAIKAPAGKDVLGTLYITDLNARQTTKIKFRIPADKAGTASTVDLETTESAIAFPPDKAPDVKPPKPNVAHERFLLGKLAHYRRLSDRNLPGRAWFRHQAQETYDAYLELQGLSGEKLREARLNAIGQQRSSTPEDSLDFYSGGRAVSENLQLSRLMPVTEGGEEKVDLATLQGITTKELDWTKLLGKEAPALDPLAAFIPVDQHALFFPSFGALTTLMDEGDVAGTPLINLLESATDAQTRGRYERQLCLVSSQTSRVLGPQLIESVAVTGSDPFFRTGTDLMVLFQAKSRDLLINFLKAQHLATATADALCQRVSGKAGSIEYTGVVSPGRAVCSYLATVNDVVVVTNSLVQLRRLDDLQQSKGAALAASPEYKFFRHRYPRGGSETAFLVLTDATIRRWCGPKWRIGASRATRATAVLAEEQARALDVLVRGQVQPGTRTSEYKVPEFGTLSLTKTGVASSTYGSLNFSTPIAELDFTHVTSSEADVYKRWREGYEQNWSQFFDPIAVTFSVSAGKLAVDVTVMPLIAGTEYREMINVSKGVDISPDAGDIHAGTLLHWILALNMKSALVDQGSNMLTGLGVKSAFDWIGQSVALYVDEDPFWAELAKAEKPDDFVTHNLHRLPLALRVEVKDSLKLALFLTSLRAMIGQTAPDLVTWETLRHNDKSYVKVAPTPANRPAELEKLAIFYAATPHQFVLTPHEDLLKRALDREAARATAEKNKDKKPAPDSAPQWQGKSLGLQAQAVAVRLIASSLRSEYGNALQTTAWKNIPILNEWKKRYPQRDPLQIEEQYWQTRLACPGGGKYVWNAEYQTMESTVFGHPGQPKSPATLPLPFANATFFNFGLTFEELGLRAKAVMEREGVAK